MRKPKSIVKYYSMGFLTLAVSTGWAGNYANCFVPGPRYPVCELSPPIPASGRCILYFTNNPVVKSIDVKAQKGKDGECSSWLTCSARDGLITSGGQTCTQDAFSKILTGGRTHSEWPCGNSCVPTPNGSNSP